MRRTAWQPGVEHSPVHSDIGRLSIEPGADWNKKRSCVVLQPSPMFEGAGLYAGQRQSLRQALGGHAKPRGGEANGS